MLAVTCYAESMRCKFTLRKNRRQTDPAYHFGWSCVQVGIVSPSQEKLHSFHTSLQYLKDISIL